jgi:hypothetical protein
MDQNDEKRGPPSVPGSPWEAMARELASNPDSPASLSIMSGMNAVMRPRQQAVDQLVLALADQLERPGPVADAAVAAAVKHWEAACQGPLEPDTLKSMQQDAKEMLERRRRSPPSLESIVEGAGERSDVGYDMGLHMQGLRGAWHRLWASISMCRVWDDAPEQRECVAVVRAQFEQALGRSLTGEEWSKLEAHAHHHAETVMKPMLDKGT